MTKHTQESGFTIVELLITLFIAAAFLVSGYQLFNLIIKDSGQTRADARASNIAYDYLKRYSNNAASPCAASTPLSNSALSTGGLSAVTISVVISCPYSSTVNNVSKIDVTVLYNSPQQTMKYSTYVTL